jgi:hypothetical protein
MATHCAVRISERCLSNYGFFKVSDKFDCFFDLTLYVCRK